MPPTGCSTTSTGSTSTPTSWIRGARHHSCTGEKIPLPDTHYDTDFWRGVDDEGLGGQFGSQ
jgi:hypothetical protein